MTILSDPPNALYAYVGAFVDELRRHHLAHAVVCPGSRSTPLAFALAAEPRIKLWMHLDERSAGYFALGLAKRTGGVVALVVTSGTAAANLFPAIVEANLTHVPLLILTADRPPELRENGAPQTIDQIRLYGSHVRWSVDLPLPAASDSALRHIRTMAGRAIATTQGGNPGPVHLNFPFREPLVPAPAPLPPANARDPVAWSGRPADAPYVSVQSAVRSALTTDLVEELADTLLKNPRGLILVGPHNNPDLARDLLPLAHALEYPLLADPLSQFRGIQAAPDHPDDLMLTHYDAFLRSIAGEPGVTEGPYAQFADAPPAIVLRFGAMPTAKPLLQYLQRHPDHRQLVFVEDSDWPEPTSLASTILRGEAAAIVRALNASPAIRDRAATVRRAGRTISPWLAHWQSAERAASQAIQQTVEGFDALFEGRVFLELGDLLPADATLVVGNSMPIRDCDTFFAPRQPLRVYGNRGANGIDGITSTALGISAGGSSPTVLVIGDLSLYHDLNGLLAAKLYPLHLTIVLIDNDGGGIFSFLSQAEYPEQFEQLFGTPTGLDCAPAVAMYGGTLTDVADWGAFRRAVQAGIAAGGLRVVRLRTDRATNVTMHRAIWAAVSQALTHADPPPAMDDDLTAEDR